jgi:hypothetical protein
MPFGHIRAEVRRFKGWYNTPAAVFTTNANWVKGNFHYVTGAETRQQLGPRLARQDELFFGGSKLAVQN